jgi:hypothetical protein
MQNNVKHTVKNRGIIELFQKLETGNCHVIHKKIWSGVKGVRAPQYTEPAVTNNSILKGIG